MLNENPQTENNNENILIWSAESKRYFCNIYAKNKNENIEKDIEIDLIIRDIFFEKIKSYSIDENYPILRVLIDPNCINLNIEGFDNSKRFDKSLKEDKFINLKRIIGKKDLNFVTNPQKFLEYNLERFLETFTGHRIGMNLEGSFRTQERLYS